MTRLPADLAEPLHILEPRDSSSIRWLLLLALLALLLWAYRRWQRKPAQEPAPQPPPRRPSPSPAQKLAAEVREIRDAALASGRIREGCHQLAGFLRRLLESGGLPQRLERSTTLTAREIAGRLGLTEVSALLHRVAGLQFGEREPQGEALKSLCGEAEDLVLGDESAKPGKGR